MLVRARKAFPVLLFVMGILFLLYSWYISYPLSVDSVSDVLFNHIPASYWVGISLLLASSYVLAVSTKNSTLKWVFSVGIVLTIYSLSYFYRFLPGSDSQFFRGLTEYSTRTGNLDPLVPNHGYFQWPSYFILINAATSVSGLDLTNLEFLMYASIGLMLTTTLYVYASRAHKNGGIQAVAIFFIVGFYFLNYQLVPFSLALVFFFVLLMLETRKKSLSMIVTILILFVGLSLTHAFVPLLFVLYLLIRCLLKGGKTFLGLFLLTSMIYLGTQITLARFAFANNIRLVLANPSEYSQMLETTLAPASIPLDVIAQYLSRIVTLTSVAMCGVGVFFLIIKRKMRELDTAVLVTGAVYSVLGIFLFALGSRAFMVVLIPASVGVAYLFGSRLKSYLTCVFLLILLLFAFMPLHSSFFDSQIMFQTKEAYYAENFMVDRYNWTRPSLVLSHFRVETYLQTRQPNNANFENDFSITFPRFEDYDAIVYTIGLGKNLLLYNYTAGSILNYSNVNNIYDNGFSFIGVKSSNLSRTIG